MVCICYNCRPETKEINYFWDHLSKEEREVVKFGGVTFRPTSSDVELQTLPNHKVVSPCEFVELDGTISFLISLS